MLTFAEDIIKLVNKNRVGLAENNPDETILAEPNMPVISAGMIPVKWDNDEQKWRITSKGDQEWYDYETGKPAYIMLNDGYYRSEIERGVEADQLMENNVGVGVPDDPSVRGTIFVWIPRFAYNENGEIQYIKDVQSADENWTIPNIFTHVQSSETAPDFLLTGIWFEIDVDTSYTNKINQMNKEESIYGFIKNTIAVPSNQATGNEIQKYIANLVGVDAPVDPQITDPINPNRIILHIINQKNQDPIKAKSEYSKETGLITIQVTYSQYGIDKILLDETTELTFTKGGRKATANTTGIDLKDGERKITIIDKQGNTKELKIKVTNAIYVALYTDGTLAFGRSNPPKGGAPRYNYGDISSKRFNYSNFPWIGNRTLVKTVEFVNRISPIYTNNWFTNCENLTIIKNIENLDTSNTVNMYQMFWGCKSLTTLDLSSLDISNVEIMDAMFVNCSNLREIKLDGTNTSKLTSMTQMFQNCTSLIALDLTSFNTSNVIRMNCMFQGCTNLTALDLSSFDTSSVENMTAMFRECTNLTKLDISNFSTSSVTDMSCMILGCKKLTTLDLSSFDTRNTTNMLGMFKDCSSLTTILVGENWETSQADTNLMFDRCATKQVELKQ